METYQYHNNFERNSRRHESNCGTLRRPAATVSHAAAASCLQVNVDSAAQGCPKRFCSPSCLYHRWPAHQVLSPADHKCSPALLECAPIGFFSPADFRGCLCHCWPALLAVAPICFKRCTYTPKHIYVPSFRAKSWETGGVSTRLPTFRGTFSSICRGQTDRVGRTEAGERTETDG